MTFFDRPTKRAKQIGTMIGGLLMTLPLVPAAVSAAPVAQNTMQQPGMNPNMMQPGMNPNMMQQQPGMTDASITPIINGQRVLSQIKFAELPKWPQNPCPGIYYENPFNTYVVVPQVCRPNLITQQLAAAGVLESIRPASPATPGLYGAPSSYGPSGPYGSSQTGPLEGPSNNVPSGNMRMPSNSAY